MTERPIRVYRQDKKNERFENIIQGIRDVLARGVGGTGKIFIAVEYNTSGISRVTSRPIIPQVEL